jgi:hypothetical protein
LELRDFLEEDGEDDEDDEDKCEDDEDDFGGVGDLYDLIAGILGDFGGGAGFGAGEAFLEDGCEGSCIFLGLPLLPIISFSHFPVLGLRTDPSLHILTHLPVIGFTSFPTGQIIALIALIALFILIPSI